VAGRTGQLVVRQPAVAPVAAVWLVSQGPYSFFFPRYLLFTVGAWAILAGIGLSRLDARIAAAAVLVIAILAAGNQQVIREPGAHSWASYPVGYGGSYLDYAGAAAFVSRQAKPGDGIVYQGPEHQASWLMIGYGLQYYLARDMPNGVPVPRDLFVAETAARAASLYPVPCKHSAACMGQEARIWIIGSGYEESPYQAVTLAQATLLRPRYRLSLVKRVRSLTVFLLTRAPASSPARPVNRATNGVADRV
jgi:mannosyltransferase